MMKRYVVLQEESLLLGELVRLQQAAQVAQQAAPVAAPQPVPAMAVAGGVAVAAPPAPPQVAAPLPPMAMPAPPPALDPDDEVVDDKLVEADGVDLQALARTAAMKAEREAIDQALAKFRWNRRKAAAYLKVSYKTLLNKMKECGISEPAGAS
jgi:two-component system, NtrC family, response regulator AtoC